VQESIDVAGGDLFDELRLLVGAARHEQHQVGELGTQLLAECRRIVVGGERVDDDDADLAAHDELDRLVAAGGVPDALMAADRFAQRLQQRGIGSQRQHLNGLARSSELRSGLGDRPVTRLRWHFAPSHGRLRVDGDWERPRGPAYDTVSGR